MENINKIRVLLANSSDKDHTDVVYPVPVTASDVLEIIYFGNEECLKFILRFADNNVKQNTCLLHPAIFSNEPNAIEMLQILLKNGFDANGDLKYYSPLIDAIERKNLRGVELLLFYGAKPCQEYTYKSLIYPTIKKFYIPLQYAFSLPSTTVKNIVRYAALYVNYEDKFELIKFLRNFKLKEMRLPYIKFAELCVAEIKYLKSLLLNSNKLNLFDFLISQGNELDSYLTDKEIITNLFNVLTYTSLPVYKCSILRKCKRIDLLSSLLEDLKCNLNYEGRLTLNSDCTEKICRFLSKEDLVSLWMACVI